MGEDPDFLVTLTVSKTEFEAEATAIVLRDAGFEVHVFGKGDIGIAMGGAAWQGVLVQVRRRDVEPARAALAMNRQDSVDLDWDEVDVGEPRDSPAPRGEDGAPMAARLATAVAWTIALVAVAGLLLLLLR